LDAISAATSATLNGVDGQLATIRSAYENGLIRAFAQQVAGDVLLGGRDATAEGNWYFLDGATESEQFSTESTAQAGYYTNWRAAEPNGSTLENHLAIRPDGEWQDVPDDQTRAYVIEWDARQVLSSFTFRLTDDAGGRFAIDSSTGEITVADGSLLDFETAASHDVTVQVADAGGRSYSEVMSIRVDDVNDAPVVNRPNLIGNGDLATNDLTGWTTTGTVTANTGALRFGEGDVDGPHAASQTFATVVGKTYTLSFQLRDDSPTKSQQFSVSLDGTVNLASTTATSSPGGTSFGTGIVVFTADSSSTTLTFTDISPDGDAVDGYIDNVSVIEDIRFDGLTEDDFNNGGQTIAALLASHSGDLITDADSAPLEGIAITNHRTSAYNGWFEYSLDGGTNWTRMGYYSDWEALLLRDSDLVRFVPQGAVSETASLTFRAWDQTTGSPGDVVSTTANGGSTAFSTSTATARITSTDINDAPQFGSPEAGVSPYAADEIDGYGVSDLVLLSDRSQVIIGTDANDIVLTKFNADGTVDTGFGSAGLVRSGFGSANDAGYAIAADGLDRLIVVGRLHNGTDYDGIVMRFESDGSLDTSFASSGVYTYAGVGDDAFRDVVVQTDGKIVVAGENSADALVVRLNSDGSLDNTFDTDGIVTFDLESGGTNERIVAIDLQSDDKIILAGHFDDTVYYSGFATRLTTGGAIDTTFGGSGTVVTTFGTSDDIKGVTDVLIQADGKVVIAGAESNQWHWGMTRFNADGTLDTTFSGDGHIVESFGGNWGDIAGVEQQSDGKLIVAGYMSFGYKGQSDWVITRHNLDGSFDSSYGDGGVALPQVGYYWNEIYSTAMAADDTLVVAGYSSHTYSTTVGYFDTSGSLDATRQSGTLDGTPTFIEGGPPVVLDADVFIFDRDLSDSNYAGTTLTLARNGAASADDMFSGTGTVGALTEGGNLVVGGTTIGTVTNNSGGTLVLTFNASANQWLLNEAVSQIAYANSSEAPPASVQIDWIFDDGNSGAQGGGGALTATGSTTVDITAVNDAPVISVNTGATVAEGGSVIITNEMLNEGDPDDSGTGVTYQLRFDLQGGSLLVDGSPLTRYDIFTQADIDAGLLVYQHLGGEDPTAEIRLRMADGGEDGATPVNVDFAITLTPVNDAPVAANDPLGTSVDLAADAVGYWRFGESAGTTAIDGTANNRDGTYHNVALGGVGVTGDGNTSAGFDGSASYVDLGTLDVDGSGLTLSAWINPDTLSSDSRIISKADGVDNADHTFMLSTFDVGTDTFLRLRISAGGHTDNLVADTGALATGSWQHVAATYDAVTGRMAIYLDGVLVEQATHSVGGALGQDNTRSVWVGANPGGTNYFDGSIDEVAILSRALDASELASLAELAPPDYSVNEDETLIVSAENGVLRNDSDVEGSPLTAVLVSGPANASSFGLNADGSFSYTPDTNFNGTDSFTYRAFDGADYSEVATVHLTVINVDDPAVITGDTSFTGDEGDAVGGILAATDVDGLTDGTYFAVTTSASHGTAAIDAATGIWTFTPADTNWFGSDSFVVTVTDDLGGTTTRLVSVTLANVDDPAVITGDTSFTGDEGDAVGGILAATDVDGLTDGTYFAVTTSASHGTAAIDAATGIWTFTPADTNWFGSDSFVVTVTDDLGGTTTQLVSITLANVDDPALITGDTSFTGDEGDAVGGTLAATDVDGLTDGTYFAVTTSASHGTAAIDAATGIWTFTPADTNWFGSDSFVVTVTDDLGGTTEQVINITLANVDDPAVITGDTSFTGNEGDAVGGTLAATDVDGLTDGTYFTVTTAASNGTAAIDVATGIWTFTPTDTNWFGSDSFVVTVTDDFGGTTTQLVSITLANVDDPAVITGDTSFTGDEGDAVGGTLAATDVDGLTDGTYFTVTTPASNGTAAIDAATGVWTFTPTDINWFGSDSFTVTVTDDLGGTTTQLVSVTLANVDDPAVITGDTSFTGDEGDAVGGTLAATDVDGLTDGTYFAVTTPASNGTSTIDAATGAWTFTPADINWFGSDSFVVTVTDDLGGTTEQVINITLANVDDPAVITGDTSFTGNEGDAVGGTLAATDVDGLTDGTYFTVTTAASNGTAAIDVATGIWTFTPADINWFGSDSFTVTVTDDLGGTTTQLVSITLANVDDPAVITGDTSFTGNEGDAVGGTLAATDVDGLTDGTYFTVTTAASNGIATIDAATGVWTFTPTDINWFGPDSFVVTVTDDLGGTTEQIVSITLANTNDPPVITGDSTGAVTEDVDDDFDGLLETAGVLNVSDPDVGESSFQPGTVTGAYGDLTIDAAGNWSYSANNNQAAIQALDAGETLTDTLTVTTADGTTHDITITIHGAEDAPIVGGTNTGAVTEDGTSTASGTLTITDVDTSDNPIRFTDETPTAGDNGYGTFAITNNVWTYTLNNSHADVQALDSGETLTDTRTFTGPDGASRTVTVTIHGAEDAPTLDNALPDQNATQDSPFSYTVAANSFGDLDTSDTLTYTATLADDSPLPAWLGFDAATRTFSGTPANADVGTISVKVTANDGTSTVSDTFDLVVANTNDPPVITGDSTGAVTEDVDDDFDGLLETAGVLNVSDPDVGESSFQPGTVTGTYGSLTIDAVGNWSYNADNSQAAVQALDTGETLTDTLTVRTADGTTHGVTITIHGANDAPVVGGTNTGAVTEDGTNTASGTLTITDVDTSDNSIQFADEGSVSGDNGYGTFAIANNVWTYTLNNSHADVQALDAGETLTDTRTFTGPDGANRTVTVTIHGSEDAPVVKGDTDRTTVVSKPTVTGTLAIDTVDKADAGITFEKVDNGPGERGYGTFSLSGGTWTFTLDPTHPAVRALESGEYITDTFTFIATDSTAQIVTQTVSVRIDGEPGIADPTPPDSSDTTHDDSVVTVDPVGPLDPASPPQETVELPVASDEPSIAASPVPPDGPGPGNERLPAVTFEPLDAGILAEVIADRGDRDGASAPQATTLSAREALSFLQELRATWSETVEIETGSDRGRDHASFWRDVDDMLRQFDEDAEMEERSQRLTAEVAAGFGISLTAGFVSWALRAGSMAASLLASMPTWRHFDPLPILAEKDEEDRDDTPPPHGDSTKQGHNRDREAERLFDR
jgi:large repetitive protein